MPNVDQEVIELVNGLAAERFEAEVTLDKLKKALEADVAVSTAKYQPQIEDVSVRIKALDRRLQSAVNLHKGMLLIPGKRSFVTMTARFQLTLVSGGTKVIDEKGIMEEARKRGLVMKFAKKVQFWKFDAKKFFDYLKREGEKREHFEEYLEDVPDRDSLSIKPNSGYVVNYNGERVSPPSITVKS